MDRRAFGKVMALWAAGFVGQSVLDLGGDMPLGDTVTRLLGDIAAGKTPALGELDRVRLLLNESEAATARLAALVGPDGHLKHDLFASHAGTFSLLPHDLAVAYKTAAQTIPTATFTDIVNYASVSGSLKADLTNGFVYLTGQPHESWYLIFGRLSWDTNATGIRSILVVQTTGGAYTIDSRPAMTDVQVFQSFAFPFAVAAAENYVFLRVWQNSGGNLNVNGATFGVCRLR
jgi:hypothetical protein